MANKRITELTDVGTPANNDVLEIVDVSDTTDSPEGTSKRVLVSALVGGSTTQVTSKVVYCTLADVGATSPFQSDIDALVKAWLVAQEITKADNEDYLFGLKSDDETELYKTYRLADFGSGLIDETAELKLVAEAVDKTKFIPITGTEVGNPITGDLEFYNESEDSSKVIKYSVLHSNLILGDDVESVSSTGFFKDTGLHVNSFNNGMNTSAYTVHSDDPSFIGIIGTEEFDKQGDRKAFAQISDVEDAFNPIVVSSSQTAILNRVHNVKANATLTDPTPVDGMGYNVNVINGVATVGGVAYSVGSELYRHYHSGSWRTAEYVNGKELERFVYSNSDGVLGTTHTGDTLEAVLLSIPITAGYYQVKDWMNALFSINKPTATTNNVTYRMRIGTTGTTADNRLATFLTNQRSFAFSRYNMQFLTGDLIIAINIALSIQTDLAGASGVNTVSVNPSNAFYLTLTAQLTDSTEQVQCIGARVSRIKPSN